MALREAWATWRGDLERGDGEVKLASGLGAHYSRTSRFEPSAGTSPEELIGAAHAACFTMALAAQLGKAGFEAERIETRAEVKLESFDRGLEVVEIHLETQALVPKLEEPELIRLAENAKNTCPLSKLVRHGAHIELEATLMRPKGVRSEVSRRESAP